MKTLNRKLLRDLLRLWPQGLAIALVAAAGVMTLLLGVGTLRALSETRSAYYDRYRFADVFATATRIPAHLVETIAAIEGVARVEGRIEQRVILDIEGMAEPANALVISIPDAEQPQLNALHLAEGLLPEADRPHEVVISSAFAAAHQFHAGDRFSALLNGQKRQLTVSGIALSPEFVYSIGPGDMMPDDERFGVIWMSYTAAGAVFDMQGEYNSLNVALMRGASEQSVIDAIDDILRPYGGSGAYGRSQQISNAFLDAELIQLEAMSYMLPPIFLGVAAFLVNMTLGRLIALEREQIGLLKAVGYTPAAVAWHYIKLALLIAAIGILIGWGAGAWLGRQLAGVYAEFYKFPFLLFDERPDVFALSALAAALAATLGSVQAVLAVMRLPPAVAMAPPAPPAYSRSFLDTVSQFLPKGTAMALRSMLRRPVRSVLTVVGISLATALLVGGLFSDDSINYMIDATFFRTERQHATLMLARPGGADAIEAVRRLPGVIAAEPSRSVPVVLRNGTRSERIALTGKLVDSSLSRVLDLEFRPVVLPDSGLVLSEMLARLLGARVGDEVSIELMDGSGRVEAQRVSLIVQQLVGLGAYMEMGALNRMLGEEPSANMLGLLVDSNRWDDLFAALKTIPVAAALSLERRSLATFRATIGENVGTSRAVYILLAVIIVVGVVYNATRIQLSERARELASLRVLGLTVAEVSVILFSELAILTLLAIPFGWLAGYGICYAVTQGAQSELFRIPLVIEDSTYATAGLIVLLAAAASALVVQRRIGRLDLVAVLKTRD